MSGCRILSTARKSPRSLSTNNDVSLADDESKPKRKKSSKPKSNDEASSESNILTGFYDTVEYHKLITEFESTPLTKGGWSLADGMKHLAKADSKFKEIICKYKIPSIYIARIDEGSFDPYHNLLKGIIYQQLATNAAESIFKRVVAAFFNGEPGEILTPDIVLKSKIEVGYVDGKKKIIINGVACGLSEAKSNYIRSLSEHFNDPSKLKGVNFKDLSDEELYNRLIAVKGLGPWSVHIFMLFSLHKADVLPVGDLGFRRGLCSFYGLPLKKFESGNNAKQIQELCKDWAPYSSLASLYMWQISDEIAKKS